MIEFVKQPWWAVVGPDEGELVWQPEPSRGYVSINLTPENMPYDDFATGVQVLPPGCYVREHGHRQHHELLLVYEGTGRCEIEDKEYDLVPGSTVLFGRYARHLVENNGNEDLKFFWVFFPAAIEYWFRAIGKQRRPREPMPDTFPRPDNIDDIIEYMKLVPPRGS